MKKIVLVALTAMLGCGLGFAGDTASPMSSSVPTTSYSSRVSIPTGVFFNDQNYVKVEKKWVRIFIGGQSSEYDIRHAEMDPRGNYALVLSNGASITIYSNGRSLYYDGTEYTKKTYY